MLSGIIANTAIKPILQDVKIEVKDNCIELYATDLEIGIRYFIQIEDNSNAENKIENGIIVAPENKIESILREWIEEYIEINAESNIINIIGRDSSFKINGESDIEQFPSSPQFLEEGCLEIDPYIISQMIKRTVFVVISERIRYILSGVLVSINGNNMEMIATDGRRLSKVSRTIDNPSGMSYSCVVPVKGLVQLEKVIANDLKISDGQKLKIKVEGNRILFKSRSFILSIQLIDGKYPDCEKIIPKETILTVNVNAERLCSAVKRASVITVEGSKRMKFTFENNKLTLEAEASEIGNSRVVMDVDYSYEPFEIHFNPDFIRDMLNVVTNDIVTMEFTENGKAGVIKERLDNPASDEKGSFQYVVMPISSEN